MRSSRAAVVTPAMLLVLVLAGCGDDGGGSTVEVTDPAVEIVAEVGDRIEIALDLNLASGYRWELSAEPATAVVVYGGERTEDPAEEASGLGSQHIVFEAVGAGATTLELRYVQPWVDPPVPRSTVEYDVRVRAAGGAEE